MIPVSVISFLFSLLGNLQTPAEGACPVMHQLRACQPLAAVASGKVSQGGKPKSAITSSDGSTVPLSQVIDTAKRSRAIFVGELHSRQADHQLQLLIIKQLHEAGHPISIGLEMFPVDRQSELDKWVERKIDVQQFRRIYAAEWKMPWHLYHGIFLYAREHHIRLVGLNVSERIASKVAKGGVKSLNPEERKEVPQGVTCSVARSYLAFIRNAYREHKLSGRMFRHFCEAQVLWNKAMAKRIAEFLSAQPEQRMVVLTGIGHARKTAMPLELRRYANVPVTVILPSIDHKPPDSSEKEEADFFVL